jgi:predicted ATPase/DNA-binding XRE family transcriptional regulator
MSFGMLLKRYRRAANLTQEMLAERAGYSTTYLSKLERGERQPLALTVVALAEALDLPPKERATLEEAARRAPVPQLTDLLSQTSTAEAEDTLPPLIGRAHELARLKQHLAGEGPSVLLLVGELGIGKTRLLKEAARLGQAGGWQVLVGGCHPSSNQEPYAPVVEALGQFLRQRALVDQQGVPEEYSWLARLFPELVAEGQLTPPPWSLAPDQERRLLFATVGRFLAQVAGPVGTLLALDDLHWAGEDALDLLTSLVRPGGAASVRILGAYRQTEVHAHDPLANWLAELARLNVVEPLRIDALPPEEAAALLHTLLADRNAERRQALEEQILQRAGGVPYFLVSYAQGLRAGGLHGQSTATIGEVPWSVAETIRQRVAALPESARYLLGVVSIAGQETPRALLLGLAAQLGWGRLDVLEAVERACQARLLEEAGEGVYRFPHELIGEVIEMELSGLRRVILHQQIAEILEQQPGASPVERLAYHYLRGEQPEKAIHYLERAGDRAAAVYAHAEAEQAYRTFLELATQLGQEAAVRTAQEKLAGILRVMGRYSEALELLKTLRAAYQAANDIEALARVMGRIGHLHAVRGAAEVGIALLEPWLAALPSGAITAQQQGGLTLTLAYLFLNNSQYHEALAAAERTASFAEQAHDDRLFGQAQWHIGRSLLLLNRLEEATQRFAAALPEAERAGDIYSLYYIYLNLDLIAHQHGNLLESKQHSERALALAEQMGNPFLLAMALGSHAHTIWSLGEWKQSLQEYERAIALMRQIKMPWGATYPLLNFGLQLLVEGQEEAGRAALEEAISLAKRSRDRQAERMAQSILASDDLLCGHPEHALQRLQPLIGEAEQEESGSIACLPVLAWAYLQLGNEDQAQRLIDQALARTRERQMRAALAEALQVQARIAAHGRRWEEAEDALKEACQLAQMMSCPYDEAKLRFIAGQIALQQGQKVEARQQFETAQRRLCQLGERRYAQQVEQALAESGV